jgi:hypothetical protein
MKFFIKQSGLDDQSFNKLLLLMLHSFFLGMFISIYLSIANAEFVSVFGREYLPFGYLLSGIIGYLTVHGYGRLLRNSGYRAFLGGLLFLLSATLIFKGILFFTDHGNHKVMIFIIFLFVMPFVSISGLAQTGLVIKTFGFADTKKFAGIINSGGTIASIIGYLSVPALIPFLNSPFDLLYVCIFAISIAFFLLTRINKNILLKNPEAISNSSTVGKKNQSSLWILLKQPYSRYIAICGVISMMAYYFIDYSFLLNAKSVTSSPSELASVIGGFFGIIKGAELVLSLFSGRIFRRFGLKTGIVLLPLLCLLFGATAIVTFHFADGFVFVAVIFSLKFFERMVSKAIEDPAIKNLYQLLPTDNRLSIQAKIDGGAKQLAIIVASVILMIYSEFMPSTYLKIGLLYVSIPMFLFWLYSARQLVKSFKEKLREILNPENLDNTRDSVSPFNKLRSLFLNEQQSTSKNVLLNILSYKINLPFEKKQDIQYSLQSFKNESYVPNSFFNYLVPTSGYSRLEFDLYKPILVIPNNELTLDVSETKSIEYLSEKEILRLAFSVDQPSDIVIKALGKKLDDLKQKHEKKIVINILERSNEPLSTKILLNHLDYPDYYIRKEIFKSLENKNFKITVKEEMFFRTSIESTLSDLTYIISALSAIPNTDEYSDLTIALLEEESILKNRLLSVLTWKYEKASIKVIRENIFPINSDNKNTNNILALELIDNLVENEIKSRIMTVFESGSYLQRLSVLNKWYYFTKLNLKETLTNILYYDYTKMGTWSKACALKIMLDDINKEYKHIISGFIYHPNSLLCLLSHEYSEMLNGNYIYPLLPKEEDFLPSDQNILSNLKGTEIYNCLKILKANFFFKKTSLNDLVEFSYSIHYKKLNGTNELAGIGNSKNKPFFILNGNIIFEFKNNFPDEILSKNCIVPELFNANSVSKILFRSQTSLYEFSPVHFANLILASDSLINDVLENES